MIQVSGTKKRLKKEGEDQEIELSVQNINLK